MCYWQEWNKAWNKMWLQQIQIPQFQMTHWFVSGIIWNLYYKIYVVTYCWHWCYTIWKLYEVSEDIVFVRDDLQRIYATYVDVIYSNIPDITENATKVDDFIRILKLLRYEAEHINNMFTKNEDDYQETYNIHLTTESKVRGRRSILLLGSIFKHLFGVGTSKDSKNIQR